MPEISRFYGMIVKAILWSAKREPVVKITSFRCKNSQALLTVKNSSSPVDITLELITRSTLNGEIKVATKQQCKLKRNIKENNICIRKESH